MFMNNETEANIKTAFVHTVMKTKRVEDTDRQAAALVINWSKRKEVRAKNV